MSEHELPAIIVPKTQIIVTKPASENSEQRSQPSENTLKSSPIGTIDHLDEESFNEGGIERKRDNKANYAFDNRL